LIETYYLSVIHTHNTDICNIALKNTYVVDLRKFKDFSPGKFIKDYGVIKVLIIGVIIIHGRER